MVIDQEHDNNPAMLNSNGSMYQVIIRKKQEWKKQWVDIKFLLFHFFLFKSIVLVKIFKLLVNELNHLNESILFDDESDDSDDDHLNVETDPGQSQNCTSPPKVFHTSDLWYEDDEDEDDQLLKELEQDPIFQTSLKDTLTKFLQNFATTEKFAEYIQHLNEHEKSVLRSIQVNVWLIGINWKTIS